MTTAILDEQVPQKTVRCRRRPSDPWFDEECKTAKRELRRLERRVKRSSIRNPSAAVTLSVDLKALRRSYKQTTDQKKHAFWNRKLQSEQHRPTQLWSSINALLGRGRCTPDNSVTADQLNHYFTTKTLDIHEATAGFPSPVFTPAPTGLSFSHFRSLSTSDIVNIVTRTPNKHNAKDSLPFNILKDNIDILAPFITNTFNQSLSTGIFPTTWKHASITPILKKGNRDPSDVASYRPISNLCTLSKLLERLVARQLLDYLTDNALLPGLQSAYRAFHSTETALLKVSSDILSAIDHGDFSLISLLDLSSAFDSVHHDILLQRLELTYGLSGHVLSWFSSFLTDRQQSVTHRSSRSPTTPVLHGVPQGSVLGPLLFLLYTADLPNVIASHDLMCHAYADDLQIYGSCHPSNSDELRLRMSRCISDVNFWLQCNRLQLNTEKTEVMWCSSHRRRQQLPQTFLDVGDISIAPATSLRNLGAFFDPCFSMRSQVSHTVSACFSALRQLRSIRRSIPQPVLNSLLVSLVHSRLDYCCSLLYGLPGNLISRLQSILNASARILFNARSQDHVTPLLKSLQWLPVRERILYRIATIVYKCLRGEAPSYLTDEIHPISEVESRKRLRSASSSDLVVPSTRLKTIGARAFPSAAARVWNDLPPDIRAAPSLRSFKRVLKLELVRRAFL